MPTPFYHLSLAQEILAHPALHGATADFLRAGLGDFLFGNTAPDVTTVSGQPRESTHFFEVPLVSGALLPWQEMWLAYPTTTFDQPLPSQQRAFLAGYICHLLADVFWIEDVFWQVFGPQAHWEHFHHRLYLHNVLRAYLDKQIVTEMPVEAAALFAGVSPDNWLPFSDDVYLLAWRDILHRQLLPGAPVETVEIFARRHNANPQPFYDLIQSEEQMDKQVFVYLTRQRLAEYRQRVVISSVELLNHTFAVHSRQSFQEQSPKERQS